MPNKTETDSVCKKITFSSDGFLLNGTLHLPPVPRPPVVIGSHGLFSDGDSPKQIALAEACNQCGIAFFRFDHRGCGQSEGVFNDVTSLQARCNDLTDAIKILRSGNDTENRTGLFGSSLGGAACLTVASVLDVDSLVTVAAPVRITSDIEAINAIENSANSNMPDTLFYKKNLQFDISDKLSMIRNILIFHGDADDVVPVSHAREIWEKAGDPKKLIIQRQGDHRISDEIHQKEFIKETVSWFRTTLLQQ
ncbi:alpha/beta hydrolase [Desulfonema magnum]|uniref:Serine aminopeptidase, S33-type n=1 Tax=Desulfonema magnum TaxID=45655 RepID=A0A975BN41_9BACT|nr:alpha/beta fold hydrolase [Desulfonema magnum]QTA87955.1 Serine aminopeptidase, S33-type [Desulfonema magnum]